MSELLLEMKNISKSFGDVQANDTVNLAVAKGEIRAIVGENGAGKSTLMKILNGLYPPDSGEIIIGEHGVVDISSPGEAVKLGIGMVYQHFMLIPTLSVVENMILGVEPEIGPFLDMKNARKKVMDVSEQYGLHVNPDARVSSLSVGMQQRVEILKILFKGAELLVFDEPTAVLTPQEVKELYNIMKNLKAEGKTIIFITHKLKEVMDIADKVTVVRAGKVVGEMDIGEASTEKMANMMVGRQVLFELEKIEKEPGEVLVQIKDLVVQSDKGINAVSGVSLDICKSEIVGIAGVDGNGQTELVEALTGLRKIQSGSYLFQGEEYANRTPHAITRAGVSHIPEDRHKRAAISEYNVATNLALGTHGQNFSTGLWGALLDFKKIMINAAVLVKEYDIRPPDPGKIFSQLSGGNQQKMVVAREMEKEHDFLICSQPTRGVDIGAIESIHNRILEEKGRDKAILIVSAELSEIMSLADRIAVMFEGKIVGTLNRDEATEEKLGILMTGGTLA